MGPKVAPGLLLGIAVEQNDGSIDGRLGEDHERLDRLLKQLRGSVAQRSENAGELLERFGAGLLRHMSWEDADLFPAVRARATATQRRSIESLEIDHERLRDTLTEIRLTLTAGDFGNCGRLIEWLETLLLGHNYDEEHGVYEEADRQLSPEERRGLLEKFGRTP